MKHCSVGSAEPTSNTNDNSPSPVDSSVAFIGRTVLRVLHLVSEQMSHNQSHDSGQELTKRLHEEQCCQHRRTVFLRCELAGDGSAERIVSPDADSHKETPDEHPRAHTHALVCSVCGCGEALNYDVSVSTVYSRVCI